MESLLTSLLTVVAIIWAIGFAMGRWSKKAPPVGQGDQRAQLSRELSALANDEPDAGVAKGLRRAAEHIQPLPVPIPQPGMQAAAPPANMLTTDVRQLDSVSMLLYFGAFLMITAVGLFVGLSDFEGTIKTIAVLVLALAFYGSGLYLHKAMPRLRPAALTFTAIGLLSLPLTGFAAYAYMAGQNGPLIWFFTSALCLALYTLALWQIRQSFIGYLSVFMGISLWMSMTSVIDAPIYFFGWGAVVLAAVYLVVARHMRLAPELEQPLTTSANVMVPTALMATLLFGQGTIDILHQGVTILLSAIFYSLAAWLEADTKSRLTYAVLSYFLLGFGAAMFVFGLNKDVVATGLTFGLAGSIQLIVAVLLKSRLSEGWLATLAQTTAVLLVLGAMVVATSQNFQVLAWLLVLNLATLSFAGLYLREVVSMFLGAATALILPIVVGFLAMQPTLPAWLVVGVYMTLGLLGLSLVRLTERLLGANYRRLLAGSMYSAWVLGWVIAHLHPLFLQPLFSSQTPWLAWASSAVVAACFIAAAYTNRQKGIIYVGTLVGLVAVWQFMSLQGWDGLTWLTLTIAGLGLAYYLIGLASAFSGKSLLQHASSGWVASGILVIFCAAMLPAETYPPDSEPILNAICLMLAGGLAAYESYRRQRRGYIYIGGAITMLGLQWLLYMQGIHETQLYSHLWAAYFGLLAWVSHGQQRASDTDTFTVLALLSQTGPLAWQALTGDPAYGLWLLLESVAIILLGVWLKYRLITHWGLAAAVGSVLYQLRDFQFIVLALLGAGVIGVGIYMLLRRNKVS